MGVHVILDIDPRGIDPAAWAAIHDETADLLSAWRPRLLGWGARTIEGVRVPMYTRSILCDADDPGKACWRVSGDRESLQTAESQSLHRDLAHYVEQVARWSAFPVRFAAAEDIVSAAAHPKNEYVRGPVRVFGDKTPGSSGVIRLLIDWLNAGRDLRDACRFACLSPTGPRFSPEDFTGALASTWVAIPRATRDILEGFQKPAGAAHTIPLLLGSFLLDMCAAGRHLRRDIGPAELAAALSDVFGEQGCALVARLRERSAIIEEQLAALAAGAKNLLARASERAGDDTQSLSTVASPDALGLTQRTWVEAMAWSTMQVLDSMRGMNPKVAAVLADAKEAKRLIVRVLSENGPVLTEDAWDVMLAEKDPEVLAWRFALVATQADGLQKSQVRRALLENAVLLKHAMALGRDEKRMREVGELVDKAREHEQGARR